MGWLPLAVHPPDGGGLGQADLDQLRQAVLPVQDVRVLQCVHQLVGRLALRRPLLDQRLDAQGGQVLAGEAMERRNGDFFCNSVGQTVLLLGHSRFKNWIKWPQQQQINEKKKKIEYVDNIV